MKYRALVGLNYPNPKGGEFRAEAGDVVDNIPRKSVAIYLRLGQIEPVADDAGEGDE
jgi:hypothetical protein